MSSVAFTLYLVFITSWFLHLPARIPALGVIRFDMLLVATIGALAFSNRPPSMGRVPKLLVALVVYIVLTTPLVEWPGSVVKVGLIALVQAMVFYFFTTWLVTSERRLKLVVGVFVVCQVIRILEPVYLHVTEGYWGSKASMAGWDELERLSGAPTDVINPNGLAFVILTAMCFMHYLWPLRKTGALAYLLVLPVCLYALVLTGSRSGLIGLFVVFAAIFLRSRHKVPLLAAAALCVAIAAPRLSADLADRYLSIISDQTRNAQTAEDRLTGMIGDLEVAMRRPLFGHGLGTSREANANFRGVDLVSHNMYTEILQELGIGGLIIFLLIIFGTIHNLRFAIRSVREGPEQGKYLLALANALSVWLALNIIFSFASYGLSNYTWYFTAGMSEALLRLPKVSGASAAAVEPLRPVRTAHAPSTVKGHAQVAAEPRTSRVDV
jgi:putative inorganic carbon (HCO3(-)) transporter